MASNIAFGSPRRWAPLLAATAMAALPLLFASIQLVGAAAGLQLTVVSSRPDMVTGGDALVRISRPDGDTSPVRVTLNGTDVTSAFAPDRDSKSLLGLVGGLAPGKNTLT